MSVFRKLLSKLGLGKPEHKRYVGTNETSGKFQFELLKREGCQPSSKVLEVGCGCLHAGVPIMQFVEKGHFAGIDPNPWLREETMKDPVVRALVDAKTPQFLSVDDFDASSLNMKFDYILSHSVLSHAAHWQLEQFLKNTLKVLAPAGRIVASIRLAEGNKFGSPGSPNKEDTMDKEWVYPGVSFFKMSTIAATADALGLKAEHKPDHTAFYTQQRPKEFHDWFVFSRKVS